MKAQDFNLRESLKLDAETGVATFMDSRLVIFDSNAIGLLRQNLVEELGVERARQLFLRFGYQNGFADFMQMKINHTFDTEMDLLASGPVIHTWEGIVHARPLEISYDRPSGRFFFTGVWTNSYEAEQHLSYNDKADAPVCWSLMGYASGWSTAFFGRPLIAIEPVCRGMGHDHCEWKIMPPEDWGEAGKPYVAAYKSFFEEKRHG
jgi:hypothetical protein